MNATFWISGAAVIVALAAWRLRRAAHKVDRILAEERDRPVVEEPDGDPTRTKTIDNPDR